MKRIIVILSIVAMSLQGSSFAQMISMGRSSADVPLSQIKTKEYRLIFPTTYQVPAMRISALLDTIHPYISTGIGRSPRAVPIIMRTENVLSNGFVTWAPKREELVMTPTTDTYALLWSKQLAIHEWRHVSQISSLNHGVTKVFTWLLGEAGYGLGLFPLGNWILEGDATLAETQFAEFGRGVQPDFTVGYRTLFAEGRKSFRYMDPWVCGSYRVPYPNYYNFSYQIASWADTNLGSDYIGSVLRYTGTWPIFIFSPDIRLKRKYETTYHRIAQKAFAELDSIWAPQALVDENFEVLTSALKRNYTQYQWPVAAAAGVAAVKTDWKRPQRLVLIDSAAHSERRLSYVGPISSRPELSGSKLYWTEYKPHPIYEQDNFSLVRSFDLVTRAREVHQRWGRNFFVTSIGDRGFATVAYDQQMRGYIQLFDSLWQPQSRHTFTEAEISLHGLAYDTTHRVLAYIALSDGGMWIGAVDSAGVHRKLTRPSVVSVSELRAANGRLYFSSIESGKNEIHSIDIGSLTQYQLSNSRFGSTAPWGSAGDTTLLITHRAHGDMIARSVVSVDTARQVEWSRLPQNTLNPNRKRWDVPLADSLQINDSTAQANMTEKGRRVKRYRRASQFFNIHSWVPLSIDPTGGGDRNLSIPLGVTAMFQSPMSDFDGYVSYGYINDCSLVKGSFSYRGLPVVITAAAEYGGGGRTVYGPASPDIAGLYFGAGLTLSLPLNLSGFHSLRRLEARLTTQYTNSLLWSDARQTFDDGYVYYDASVRWSSARRRAYRALTSRLGYDLTLSVRGAFDERFATMYSLLAKGYLPGVIATHSIVVKTEAQYQPLSYLNFQYKAITARGYYDNTPTTAYGAAGVEYFAPIAYPDWGWDGVIFLKRIWGSAFYDASYGRYVPYESLVENRFNYSYGVNVGLDFTLLRAYAQGLSLTFAMPNNTFYFGVGYSLGF